VRLAHAAARAGQTIRVVGIVSALRRARTADGRPLLFVTLEDESGLLEGTVGPAALARGVAGIALDACLAARGRMRERAGAPGLDIAAVRVIDRP
jgi:DNA polymerase III alpha subunit